MKKYFFFLITLLTIAVSTYCISFLNVNENTPVLAKDKNLLFSSLSADEQIDQYSRIIEFILFDSIYESINKVYGENQRGFWEFEIIEIERGYYPAPFDYRFTVKFETYTRAHNEPFDENIAVYDMINFSPLTIKEVSFEHHSLEIVH